MDKSKLGLLGWAAMTIVAIVPAYEPGYQVLAIVAVIAGAGFGIMAQIAAVVDGLKKTKQ